MYHRMICIPRTLNFKDTGERLHFKRKLKIDAPSFTVSTLPLSEVDLIVLHTSHGMTAEYSSLSLPAPVCIARQLQIVRRTTIVIDWAEEQLIFIIQTAITLA